MVKSLKGLLFPALFTSSLVAQCRSCLQLGDRVRDTKSYQVYDLAIPAANTFPNARAFWP